MPRLRQLEHARRGGAHTGASVRNRLSKGGAASKCARRSAGARLHRHFGVRPRARRRTHQGHGRADRRRSGHRQIDASAGSRGQPLRARSRAVRFGRGEQFADQAPRRPARRQGRKSAAVYRDLGGGRDRTREGVRGETSDRRLDPDHADRSRPERGGQRFAGAGGDGAVYAVCEGYRHDGHDRRTRHQGRRDRGTARARTHRRHGAVL